MRHTIALKMPKLFNKKQKDTEPEVVTEVDLSEREDDIKQKLIIGGAVVAGLTVGYLVGFRSGALKAGVTYIVKNG